MQCPKCGYMMLRTDTYCLRCRLAEPQKPTERLSKPKLQTHASNLSSTPPSTVSPPAVHAPNYGINYVCCGNGNVQKASAIHHAGTWSASSVAYGYGSTNYSSGQRASTNSVAVAASGGATNLAYMLSPPPRPTFSAWPAILLPLTLFVCHLAAYLACVGITAAAENSDSYQTPGFANCPAEWAVCVLAFALIVAHVAWCVRDSSYRNAQMQRAYPVWQKEVAIWQELFYCGRCNCVYRPRTGKWVDATQLGQVMRTDMTYGRDSI